MTAVFIVGVVRAVQFHSKSRRRIPLQRYRVADWREYDAALRDSRSLKVWFTEEALAG
jgi:hypothetical protein